MEITNAWFKKLIQPETLWDDGVILGAGLSPYPVTLATNKIAVAWNNNNKIDYQILSSSGVPAWPSYKEFPQVVYQDRSLLPIQMVVLAWFIKVLFIFLFIQIYMSSVLIQQEIQFGQRLQKYQHLLRQVIVILMCILITILLMLVIMEILQAVTGLMLMFKK